MKYDNLFSRMANVVKEIETFDRENPTGRDEKTNPRS